MGEETVWVGGSGRTLPTTTPVLSLPSAQLTKTPLSLKAMSVKI